jgi:hypothetical protein
VRATLGAIDRRASAWRYLIMSIALIGVASVLAAASLRDPRWLLALLSYGPLVCVFLLHDAYVLGRWEDQLLTPWAAGLLQFQALRATLHANKAIPGRTLQGMLASLPADETDRATAEQRRRAADRVRRARVTAWRCALAYAAGTAGTAGLLAGAALLRSLSLLAVAVVAGVLAVMVSRGASSGRSA